MTFPALLGSPFEAAQVAQVCGQFGIHASANVTRRLESAFTATGASRIVGKSRPAGTWR